MIDSPLQGGDRRRRAWARRLGVLIALLVPLAGGASLWFVLRSDNGGALTVGRTHPAAPAPPPAGRAPTPVAPPPKPGSPSAVSLEAPDAFTLHFKRQPRAGLVFDLRTGRVLWRLRPLKRLPIASLTKLMTALLVTEKTSRHATAKITRASLRYQGSGVGLLPKGRRVSVQALMFGLLLPSGNDAAIALADRISRNERRFVRLMNAKARSLGLRCTHYVSSHGLEPGNRSCSADLATLTRVVMRHRRIARIVRRPQAKIRFPIKGGKLYLYSTNPLLRNGYRGTIGLKTGDTDEAGHCLIAVVRRGSRTIGAVLLHSPNPPRQARSLFAKAFRADR